MNNFLVNRAFLCSLIFLACSCSGRKIPFSYNGHINVKVALDGVARGSFIYDTGAPILYIDSTFSKESSLKFNYKTEGLIGGVGNNTQTITTVSDTISFTIGRLKNYSNKTGIVDFKSIAGSEVDGLLGISSFKFERHKVDFYKKKISFDSDTTGYYKIKVIFENNQIHVPVTIFFANGITKSYRFLLDTGSPNTVLNNSLSTENNISGLKYHTAGGTGGQSIGFLTVAKKIEVGNLKLETFGLGVSKDTSGALAARNRYDGILGNDFLQFYDVIIDVINESLFLRPNKFFKTRKKAERYFGFAAINDSKITRGWKIKSIYEDSDAFKKGLRINDIILEINDRPIKSVRLKKLFRYANNQKTMKLKVRRLNETFFVNCLFDEMKFDEK